MIVTLLLSSNIVTNYDYSYIYDYNTTCSFLHHYTCIIHSLLLYNYIVEYDFATALPHTLDILIPTVFDKYQASNLLHPSILQKIVQRSLKSTKAA